MKALLCHAFGPIDRLTLEDVLPLTPGKGEVVIAVRAAGANFPDTLIVEGKYQVKPPFPFAPGGEFAGTVKSVGEGVTRVNVGDPVIGLASHGGFAEEARVHASTVIPLPPGADFEIASALMVAHGTALHALKDRAQLKSGETLVVLGAAGGTGLAAVEIGKLLGATVIAAASSDAKQDICRRFGADHTIDYTREDLKERIRALTEGRGADVVFDPVGGELSEPALRSTAWNGRFLVIGFASGTIPKLPLNLPLLKSTSIVGVYWGEFMRREPQNGVDNVRQLMEWVATKKIAPHISARYPLDRAVEALEAIKRREVTGKVVIIP